ncbi:YchJ family protein [Marmoricola sp. RAF53]|uniref:YchJ family protein n=1 Tax=Marmoricola sp. RAF53 TaxID=3233059 RepID=UPI003F9CA23B
MTGLPRAAACPCGSGTPYDVCCGPLHRQERQAATPEELMRSRYSAFAVGDGNHLFRTWHPRTRPEDVDPDPGTTWTGLEVLDATEDGDEGTVEFRASWTSPAGSGVLHERSRFTRRAGRWVYVDGEFGEPK